MHFENEYNPLKLRQSNEEDTINEEAVQKTRKINKMPFKVLDAP